MRVLLLSLVAAGMLLSSGHPKALFTRDAENLPRNWMSPKPGHVMPPRATSLCRKDEQVLFACKTAASKIISLCGSKELEEKKGYLQYRFGKPGALELQFPEKLENTQSAFRYDNYFRAQVSRTHLRFDNGGYRYELFYYYEGDISPKIIQGGVTVEPPGKDKESIQIDCLGRVVSRLAGLESVVPPVEDSDLNPQ
ncbi:MAG: hypothetical protein ACRD8U_10770 [Pyrinomonadaceae bacterium]